MRARCAFHASWRAARDDERAWLVLEWLDLAPLDAKAARALGTALAALHRIAQRALRLGARQLHRRLAAGERLVATTGSRSGATGACIAQLRLAAHNRLPSRMIDRGERLAGRLRRVLPQLSPGEIAAARRPLGRQRRAPLDGTAR